MALVAQRKEHRPSKPRVAGSSPAERTTTISQDVGAAVNNYLLALRHLKRKETTCANIAKALGLPEQLVEKSFDEFKMKHGKIGNKKQSHLEMLFSAVVEIKS